MIFPMDDEVSELLAAIDRAPLVIDALGHAAIAAARRGNPTNKQLAVLRELARAATCRAMANKVRRH